MRVDVDAKELTVPGPSKGEAAAEASRIGASAASNSGTAVTWMDVASISQWGWGHADSVVSCRRIHSEQKKV